MSIFRSFSGLSPEFHSLRRAYKSEFHPDPRGDLFHYCPKQIEKLDLSRLIIGYHGTSLNPTNVEQIKKGEFRINGKRIYLRLTPDNYVGLYAKEMGENYGGVILRIASEATPQKCEEHNQYYFPEGSRVYILEAHKLKNNGNFLNATAKDKLNFVVDTLKNKILYPSALT